MQLSPIEWAKFACDSLMALYAAPELPPAGRWHYHQGVFLRGMEMLWEVVREDRYDAYIRQYVDALIDEHGNLYFARDELDAIQAGQLLFRLDSGQKDDRYRKAAAKLRNLFHTLNQTSEGGFWHKDKYPYQMWLDGLYMGGVFALQYANAYGDQSLVDMVLHQEELMRKHMKDSNSGLLYHAWDEKRRMPWADPVTGCSPEFWGRSLGWYSLALAEFIDLLPADASGREQLMREQCAFIDSLIRYQDADSGLWYQVVDKGERPDNWLETSCSSLFVYTIASAVRQGVVQGSQYEKAAIRGYEGLVRRMKTDSAGRFIMPEICIGTSAGDYENYVTRPTSDNDLHGVGAFVMACIAIHHLQS